MASTYHKNLKDNDVLLPSNEQQITATTEAPSMGLSESVPSGSISYLDGLLAYTRVEGGYAVTGIGTVSRTEVIIPTDYSGTKIVEIAENAFKGNTTITKITIPNTVKKIGLSAFEGASIKEVILEDSNTTSIFFKNSLNWNLPCLRIPGEPNYGGWPGKEMNYNEDENRFYGVIPSNVTSVYIVSGDGTHQIAIPLEQIKNNVCFEVVDENTIKRIDYIPPSGFNVGDSLVIGENAFKDCSNLEAIDIPLRTAQIGTRAFHCCTQLSTLTFHKNSRLTEIGMLAFRESGITEVKLPEGLVKICASAFSYCASLTDVILSASLEEIETFAFTNCTKLHKCYYNDENSEPRKLKSIASYAFQDCGKLTIFNPPSSVTYIGSHAFHGACSTAGSGLNTLTLSVTFGETKGWFRSQSPSFDYESLILIKPDEISHNAAAGNLLTGDYMTYNWYRLTQMPQPQISIEPNSSILTIKDPLGYVEIIRLWVETTDGPKIACTIDLGALNSQGTPEE